MKKMKQILRNEKGLTLIELLAVVVILAIIAAIAIPAIAGLIDNTKKDAHVANAEQMINAGRLKITGDADLSVGTKKFLITELVSGKYLEKIQDPDKKSVSYKDDSYVEFKDGVISKVHIEGEERTFTLSGLSGSGQINRDDIPDKGGTSSDDDDDDDNSGEVTEE